MCFFSPWPLRKIATSERAWGFCQESKSGFQIFQDKNLQRKIVNWSLSQSGIRIKMWQDYLLRFHSRPNLIARNLFNCMKYTAIPVIKLEIFASYTYHPVIINITLKQTYRKTGILLQVISPPKKKKPTPFKSVANMMFHHPRIL